MSNNKQDIEIETFVHGAICVSYSGQCLMSSFSKNRSANKGMCAQCCRLKYELLDEVFVFDENGNKIEVVDNTFVMPESQAYVSASYKVKNPETVDLVYIVLFLLIISLIVGIYTYKKFRWLS